MKITECCGPRRVDREWNESVDVIMIVCERSLCQSFLDHVANRIESKSGSGNLSLRIHRSHRNNIEMIRLDIG